MRVRTFTGRAAVTTLFTMTTYRAVVLTGKGGLERLEERALPLLALGAGEVRIRVRAAGAGATDVSMRTGSYPYRPPFPFTVGYEVVGDVDALGPGVSGFEVGERVCALTVHGAQAEHLTRSAEDFVKVPEGLDDAQVVAVVLNYVTAYQMIHRCVAPKRGMTALVTGANGGVGSALVELLALAGVEVVASKRGTPPDETVRLRYPEGVDMAFDGLGGRGTAACTRATKRGGMVVGYGFMATSNEDGTASTFLALLGFWSIFVGAFFAGRRGAFYGITQRYRKDRTPFKEDLAILLRLLADGTIAPRIAARLSLLDGVEAQRRLERGGVAGKIVLLRDHARA